MLRELTARYECGRNTDKELKIKLVMNKSGQVVNGAVGRWRRLLLKKQMGPAWPVCFRTCH